MIAIVANGAPTGAPYYFIDVDKFMCAPLYPAPTMTALFLLSQDPTTTFLDSMSQLKFNV